MEYDFILPEFLNVLVFQQKNLVVFPYVDLKRLRSLEIFAVGYNVINLESTAISNLKDVLEYEANNSYSQSKNLYFVYNLDAQQIKQIMSIQNFRCVLNTKENVSDLVDGGNYVFYNKKVNKFVNYDPSTVDLEFETYLINNSKNESVLLDCLQTLNSKALRIFNDLNLNGHLNNLPEILKDYDKKFWPRILSFVEALHQIKIPPSVLTNSSSQINTSQNNTSQINTSVKDFSEEYKLIANLNAFLSKSFFQTLHQEAQNNKELNGLDSNFSFYPQELYHYLRTHYWNDKIPNSFVNSWLNLKNSYRKFNDKDWDDLKCIADKSDFLRNSFSGLFNKNIQLLENTSRTIKEGDKDPNSKSNLGSVSVKNFEEYKKNIYKKLERINKYISSK